jgi:hypothetical protein
MMYLAIFSMASSLWTESGTERTLMPECRHDKISLATSSVILPFRKCIPRRKEFQILISDYLIFYVNAQLTPSSQSKSAMS